MHFFLLDAYIAFVVAQYLSLVMFMFSSHIYIFFFHIYISLCRLTSMFAIAIMVSSFIFITYLFIFLLSVTVVKSYHLLFESILNFFIYVFFPFSNYQYTMYFQRETYCHLLYRSNVVIVDLTNIFLTTLYCSISRCTTFLKRKNSANIFTGKERLINFQC